MRLPSRQHSTILPNEFGRVLQIGRHEHGAIAAGVLQTSEDGYVTAGVARQAQIAEAVVGLADFP